VDEDRRLVAAARVLEPEAVEDAGRHAERGERHGRLRPASRRDAAAGDESFERRAPGDLAGCEDRDRQSLAARAGAAHPELERTELGDVDPRVAVEIEPGPTVGLEGDRGAPRADRAGLREVAHSPAPI